jgi:hypothetical protein
MADKGWYGKVNDKQKEFNEWFKQSWGGSKVIKVAGAINENIMPAIYAFMRQGAKEAGQALKAFPDSIHPVEEIGTMGNPTQLTVNQEQGNVWGKPDAARDPGFDAQLDAKAMQASRQGQEDRGLER